MKKFLFVFSLCFFLLAGAGLVQAGDQDRAKRTILEIFDHLKQNHIGQPGADLLMEGAVRGMIDSLNDPYTTYLTEDDLYHLTDQLNGYYEGVGFYLEAQPDYPRVQEVFPGSPAMEAGIRPGDMVKGVDGMDIKGWPLPNTVEKIKGPVGTEVVLSIDRSGIEFSVKIKRAHLNIPTIESKIIGSNTGYVSVKAFGLKTPDQFKAALDKLLSQKIGGLVVDLRDNTGGYLDAALEIAESFLEPGTTVVITKIHDGTATRHTAGKDAKKIKIPIIVLVNSKSASSSEILAGALQDNGVSLVGETTYGKGVAQSIIRLKTGGALKLTTTEYATPKGRLVNERGLEPNFEVHTPDLQLPFALAILESRHKQIVFTKGSNEVTVYGEQIKVRYGPVVKERTVYLPLRLTLESLGYSVAWDQHSRRVVAQRPEAELVLPEAGKPQVNGREINIGSRIYSEDGVTLIPVELVAVLGHKVRQSGSRIIID